MSKTKIERYSSPVAGLMGHQRRRRNARSGPRYKNHTSSNLQPQLPENNHTSSLKVPKFSPQISANNSPLKSTPKLSPSRTVSSQFTENSRKDVDTLEVCPEDTEPLESQVAGHMRDSQGKGVGILKYKNQFILKPLTKPQCGERELRFYTDLQTTTDPDLQELRSLVPHFHGTKEITVSGAQVTCLVLDNITLGYAEPCVMDIKIGRRTWDPLATPEKIQNENKKYIECKRDVGFSVTGFQVRKISDGNLYKYGKDFGRKLNGKTVKNALKLFLNADSCLCRPLLEQFLHELFKILQWSHKQRKVRLYSSSILLVYDARILHHYLRSRNIHETPNNSVLIHETQSFARNYNSSDINNSNCSNLNQSFKPANNPVENTPELHNLSQQIPENTSDGLGNENKQQKFNCMSKNAENLIKFSLESCEKYTEYDVTLAANVKMIDFAHIFPTEDESIDTNYLHGIENLVKIFEELLKESI